LLTRCILGTLLFLVGLAAHAQDRPNILWLSTEDIGPHLGCYDDPYAKTPNLDRLAAQGLRYTRAFTIAPVCAPNRTAIITGMYPTALGMHHMRAGGEGTARSNKPALPEGLRAFPAILRDAGYYCTNAAKEDYNFATRDTIWDESSRQAHWQKRPNADQPFFAVFNFSGTHEGSVRRTAEDHARATERLTPEQRQDPDAIRPPPYHPNTGIVRQQWANYYENITALDYWVGDHLKALEDAGVADNTIVIFWSDHGPGMPRGKRWLYDSGTNVPLIVRLPGGPTGVRDKLVSSIDLSPTTLNLAGLPIPGYMQGQAFMGANAPAPRRFVHGARDRMDERYDIIRMVRDARFKYIRNAAPHLPYDQFMNTAEKSPIKHELHRLAAAGELPPGAAWVSGNIKPVEELYDTVADPHELNNLAGDYRFDGQLSMMRAMYYGWATQTGDLGLIPEPELVVLAKQFGSRYAIFGEMKGVDPTFWESLSIVATLAGSPGPDALLSAELEPYLASPHTSIRYWATLGLGNRDGNEAQLARLLDDPAAIVRIAAAQALLARGNQSPDSALKVLIDTLSSDHEWERLHAAHALDALGETARPAVEALREALQDTENKYVVRVANHALNALLATTNQVR